MSELIETVFENIDKSKLINVIKCLISNDYNIISFELFFQNDQLKNTDDFTIYEAVELEYFNSMLIKLRKLKLNDNIDLNNVHLWVKKYNEKFDIEINFDSYEQDNNFSNMSQILFDFSYSFAQLFNIHNYYAGLEPACDEDTRFFTKDNLGPLKI